MLNRIIVMGRLTHDPELRYTQSQTPVTTFSLAVDRDYSGRDGGDRQTDFIDCVAWRSTAEFVNRYFQKGGMAVVSGRLQMRDYKDRDGNGHRVAEINADAVYFGESRRAAPAASSPPCQRGRPEGLGDSPSPFPAASRGVDVAPPFTELDDEPGELPF